MTADHPKNKAELVERLGRFIEFRNFRQGNINCMIGLEYIDCDFEEKTITIRHTVKDSELNTIKIMHGGLVTWLIDSAMGTLTNAWTRRATPTMNISVNFVRPILSGDEAIIKARLVHVGRQTVSASAEISVGGRVCAAAVGTFFVTDTKTTGDE